MAGAPSRPRTTSPSRTRLAIDERGYANLARRVPSPNCDARPPGTVVTLAVIHGISLPPGQFGGDAIERFFTNRLDPATHPFYASIAHLHVSAHFLLRRDGRLLQFVSCDDRAWHAGISRFRGRTHCNDFSVGVELEGTDDVRYEAAQYAMLARLLKALARRYPIQHVVGHSDIAPDRKTDPGPAFDWARLRRLTAPRR